jgi:hypothetical protein
MNIRMWPLAVLGVVFATSISTSVATAADPHLVCSLKRASLWPPNHKLVDVGLKVHFIDGAGQERRLTGGQFTISVTQDEPVDERGDGNSEPDACLEVDECGCYHLHVRAERAGNKNGRVYLITVTHVEAGVTYHDCCTVRVAHDKSKKSRAKALVQALAAEAACHANGSVLSYDSLGECPVPVGNG